MPSRGPRTPTPTGSARTATRRPDELAAETLDRILDQRRARTASNRLGGTGAALLHVAVIAGVILGPRLFASPPRHVEFVPVQLVPAPARGVVNPARPRTPPARATATPPTPPEPQPEASAAPAPTEPPPPDPAPPDKPQRPSIAPSAAPAANPPAAPATGPPGREGAPTGNPESPFTATVGGVDNPTFTYGYYLDRMLLLIRSQWTRPALGSGVEAMVHFRILRDGTVEAVELVNSSGYNSFDLAALRAVQSAAPLPPLPRSYREGELGVNLIFR
ncbi:MAG TPA: energy transducer TonB [Thermoanaerobaculia bacterium]|jgi:protein TonB|nr:energy transducer TonB [Thermoanaerobaculia bacterium]